MFLHLNDTQKCRFISHLVRPVPHGQITGLGVYVTKDLNGFLRLGPDASYIDRNNFNYKVDLAKRKEFLIQLLNFYHSLRKQT